jgi:hypothetical protein
LGQIAAVVALMEGAPKRSPSVPLLWWGWAVIDDFCKRLVAQHPASISRWLLGISAADQQGALSGGCSTANTAAIPSTPIR